MGTWLARSPNVRSEPKMPYVAPTWKRPTREAFPPSSPLQERTPVGPTGGERPQAKASRGERESGAVVRIVVNAARRDRRMAGLASLEKLHLLKGRGEAG